MIFLPMKKKKKKDQQRRQQSLHEKKIRRAKRVKAKSPEKYLTSEEFMKLVRNSGWLFDDPAFDGVQLSHEELTDPTFNPDVSLLDTEEGQATFLIQVFEKGFTEEVREDIRDRLLIVVDDYNGRDSKKHMMVLGLIKATETSIETEAFLYMGFFYQLTIRSITELSDMAKDEHKQWKKRTELVKKLLGLEPDFFEKASIEDQHEVIETAVEDPGAKEKVYKYLEKDAFLSKKVQRVPDANNQDEKKTK